jgi:hypothetical protein
MTLEPTARGDMSAFILFYYIYFLRHVAKIVWFVVNAHVCCIKSKEENPITASGDIDPL